MSNLENWINVAATEFKNRLIEIIKNASLEDLMNLQTPEDLGYAQQEPSVEARKKPGPKPGSSNRRVVAAMPATAFNPTEAPSTELPEPTVELSPRERRRKEKEDMARDILAYLVGHPDSSCAKIAQHIGKPTPVASLLLRQLRQDGKIESDGKSQSTTYRLVEN